MLTYQELSDSQSCLNKSGAEEPIFVLCARDKHAPAAVRLWAKMSVMNHPQEKIAAALEVAEAMECWRAEEEINTPIKADRRPNGDAACEGPYSYCCE